MKRQLSAEGNYTEAELEEYMQSHKKLMIDSLWKLNVADIEATLTRVCQMVLQDSNAKKEELCLRGRALKTLGKIFQRVKTVNGVEGENANDPLMKSIRNEGSNNTPINTSAKSSNHAEKAACTNVKTPQSTGAESNHVAQGQT